MCSHSAIRSAKTLMELAVVLFIVYLCTNVTVAFCCMGGAHVDLEYYLYDEETAIALKDVEAAQLHRPLYQHADDITPLGSTQEAGLLRERVSGSGRMYWLLPRLGTFSVQGKRRFYKEGYETRMIELGDETTAIPFGTQSIAITVTMKRFKN